MRVVPREGQVYFDSEDLRFAERCFPELRSLSSHFIWDPARWLPNQHSFFSLLREPVARTASTYQYKVAYGRFQGAENAGTKEHFANWVSNPENQNYQIRQISGGLSLDRAQEVVTRDFFFLGLTEHLIESVEAMSALSPVPLDVNPPTPRHRKGQSMSNWAADNSVKKMLLEDPAMRQLLESGNRLDTAFYDWVKSEMYPRYLEQAEQADPRPTPVASIANYRRSKFINNALYAPAQRLRYTLTGQKEDPNPVF